MIKSYKDLSVWKAGLDIVDSVYKLAERMPDREKYVLASQMTRAAVSIPSNIAEGHTRQHTSEYRQFCSIALGSCAELETQLEIALRRKYISQADFKVLAELLDHEGRMLTNLIKTLNTNSRSTTPVSRYPRLQLRIANTQSRVPSPEPRTTRHR